MHRHHQPAFRRYKGFFPLAIVAFYALLTLVVMLLWNAILPEVTGVRPLNFWQALGLLLLCRILFGGFRYRGRKATRWRQKRAAWREKWMNMSEEERAAFREQWRERCHRGGEE